MDNCVFCNIANGTLKSDILFQNERIMVIRDILPRAPVHLQIVPKAHILNINKMEPYDPALIGEMVAVARNIAVKQGIGDTGYKLVFNVGRDGGQVIEHLHLHVLGGKKMPE